MDNNIAMAELLFGDVTETPDDYEKEYPPRNLAEGAKVTRFAPSPTGFLHIGSLFAAFIASTAAKDGVFYLRIEDTDKKREVENGVSEIIDGLAAFGIDPDEGATGENTEKGAYGPYTQSKRNAIYHAYVKSLVERGLAYPCFLTEEEIAEIRNKQEEIKALPGIYGEYAKFRDITAEEAKKRIDNSEEYVIRLRSPGKPENKIEFKDYIKGKIEMPENILDIVLLKKDMTPTYHFAHAVDDHLMRTTDVTRGDEWLSSVPVHLQLFRVLGFKPPKYAHISPVMKEDAETGGKRKLSKRKDPEAAVAYYDKAGIPNGAVLEYLMTIANSDYEDWRRANKTADMSEFRFSFTKMNKAGALFDLMKLNDISRTYISTMTAKEVCDAVISWAKKYNTLLAQLLESDTKYAEAIFAIGRGGKKPRKDIAAWSEVEDYISYFYNDLRDKNRDFPETASIDEIKAVTAKYIELMSKDMNAETWFPAVRDAAVEMGYAPNPKEYKNSPESFKGHVGDFTEIIRVAITGRRNTPDLYEIQCVLGEEETQKRLEEVLSM